MPDFRYVYNLIKQGEGQHLDFKQEITSEVKIARTLVSFTNSEGGKLLVGVDDRGDIKGVDVAQEKHILIRAAKKYCDPVIFLHFRILRAKKAAVLEVTVDAKSAIEHRALDEAGRWLPFARVGDQTVLAAGYNGQLLADQHNLDPIPILMEQNQGLVNYLDANDAISIKEYMQMMNLSYGMARRSLEELTSSGVLEREDIGGRDWYYLAGTADNI